MAALSTQGQSDTISSSSEKKIRYTNSFLAGALLGKKGNGSYTSITTIHGIRYNRLAAGLGTGYEGYTDWRVLPIFGSVSYDFVGIKQNSFFVQVNGGYSIAYHTAEREDYQEYERGKGKTFSGLIGYRIKANKFSIYISSGYKFQRIKYSYSPIYWWDSSGELDPPKTTVQRDMERFIVQIGFGLN